jgi:hypothetical protein
MPLLQWIAQSGARRIASSVKNLVDSSPEASPASNFVTRSYPVEQRQTYEIAFGKETTSKPGTVGVSKLSEKEGQRCFKELPDYRSNAGGD